jgi:hypothetical protein
VLASTAVVYEGLSSPRSHNNEDHRVIFTRFLAEHVKEDTVVAPTMDPLTWLRKHLEQADADLLRELVATFVQALMAPRPTRRVPGQPNRPALRLTAARATRAARPARLDWRSRAWCRCG